MREVYMKKIHRRWWSAKFWRSYSKVHGCNTVRDPASLHTRGAKGFFGLEAPLRDRCRPPGMSDEGWFSGCHVVASICRGTQVERAGDLEKGGDDVCAVGVRVL